jgi:uncharacterized membrane protein
MLARFRLISYFLPMIFDQTARDATGMDKKDAVGGGGGLLFGLLLGIIFDNVALGIIFGLMLGGGAIAANRKGK